MSLTCNYFSGAVPTKFSNLVLNTSGNCFDPIDNSNKIRCQQRYYDCSTFFSEVPSGTCPECPNTQILEDQSTCVCTIPSASTGSGSNKSKLIGSIVGVGVFLLVVAVLFWFLYKYRREQKRRCKGLSELWDGPEGIIRYHIEDIVAATDNFDKKHQIGVGGFGSVYLAVLDGREVAIKVANSSSIQSTMGFRNEVLLLSRLHHVNLVHLLGFCEAEGIQILGYEYMSNGNLHTMLFGNTSVLDWLTRLDIALGVAHGLEYLHSFADPPVIHRDVKLSNVLLDYNMVAKLSDFGISKVAPELDSEMATRPCGTAGYIDPQYVLTEQLTTASDVYSFGVVLLELFTGQKCINKSRKEGENLVEWVSIKLEDEGLESVVDPRLGDNYPKQMFYDMIRLGLDCAAFKSSARPSMKAVVTILDQCRWSVAPELPVLNSIGSQKAGQQDDSYSHDYVQDADKSSEVYIQLVNESTIEPPLDPR
ncbi:hypothetical protein KP509_21G032500 [Ceratopteris richardii]|nr:hypothetical protein KP509_21G032500 [Ceratopteris richardii]